jgi:hypothetical protein
MQIRTNAARIRPCPGWPASERPNCAIFRAPQREILIFPKSLQKFEGRRVIGIKYNMLKEGPVPADERVDAAKARQVPKVRKAREKPAPLSEAVKPAPVETTTSRAEDTAKELKIIKGEVRKALKALSKDHHVTAYNIFMEALGDEGREASASR